MEENIRHSAIANQYLTDRNLSLESKGIYAVLLSLPDRQYFSTKELAEICNDEIGTINNALSELKKAGYVDL